MPSGTSLLGLISHLTGVGEHWSQWVFLGQDHDIDLSMTVPPGATSGQVVAACRQACARSDEIVAGRPDLSTVATIASPGVPRRSR